jgi:putative RecB family exonuclease
MTPKNEDQNSSMHFSRIQSSSSINSFRQCPRKYFYQYIMELPGKPSIHLLRGKIAHTVLEDFFKINIDSISDDNYDFELKIVMHEILSRKWEHSEEDLGNIGLSSEEVSYYLQETKEMLQFWLLDFLERLNLELKKTKSLQIAFKKLIPKTEEHFLSERLGVQGYIDAIHIDENGDVKIIDYKTSKRDHINDEYRLQLAIYSILYHEKYGLYPKKVGLFFFKHGERLIDVDENLLEFARREVEKIHLSTKSKDIQDYPKIKSGLCRWSTGQCDFFLHCCKDI